MTAKRPAAIPFNNFDNSRLDQRVGHVEARVETIGAELSTFQHDFKAVTGKMFSKLEELAQAVVSVRAQTVPYREMVPYVKDAAILVGLLCAGISFVVDGFQASRAIKLERDNAVMEYRLNQLEKVVPSIKFEIAK